MKGAFEGKVIDRRGDEDLAPCRGDVQLGQQLPGEGICADQQLGGDQWKGMLGMQHQMSVDLFISGDLYIVEHGDIHGLDEAQQGLA